jgi:hypothetical protein
MCGKPPAANDFSPPGGLPLIEEEHMKKIDLKPKHLLYSTIGFSIGYLASIMIEGEFGWHAYIAGLLGNIIGYTIVVYIIE